MKFELKKNNKNVTDKELLDDLVNVAMQLGKKSLTYWEYTDSKINRFHSGTIATRFGKWNTAVEKAGLEITLPNNISDKELFKNLENVWIYLGRQPGRREMTKANSKYSESPYINRFGTWYKALEAFVEFINLNSDEVTESEYDEENIETHVEIETEFKHKTKRQPSERLKVQVLMRDGNKCRLCGITVTGDNIHFDHILPWSKGGETTLENLQILCAPHNLAKGNLEYENK